MIIIQFVKFEKKDKFCPYSQAIFPVKFFKNTCEQKLENMMPIFIYIRKIIS